MASSRKNSALKIFTTGKSADGLHGLAKRVGGIVDAYSVATQRAAAGVRRKVVPIAKRHMLDRFNVRSSLLSDRIRVEGGYKKTGDYISLWASTRQLPLIAFGGKWGGIKTPGATAAIQVSAGAKIYDHAFIASVKGLKSIRVRSFKNGKRAGRGPLRILRGPSPYEMIVPGDRPGLAGKITQELVDFYVAELIRQRRLEARS